MARRTKSRLAGGSWAAVALAVLLSAVAAAPAIARDANSVPPTVDLAAAGSEGILGARAETLAYFETPSSFLDEFDESWEYPPGSKVTFTCVVDDRPVSCKSEYVGADGIEGELLRASRRARREPAPLGSFVGRVPVPERLSSGPHTVTVVATDEDGRDPNPPSVEVIFDREPPSKPALIAKPPKRSRIHKPNFRFRSTDGLQLVSENTSFFGRLRRVKPTREVFRGGGWDANQFEPWTRSCPTLLTCTGQARVEYSVPGFGVSLGMRQWLPPGVYDVFLSARDAAGNKSELTRYRFRILRGRPPR